MNRPSAIISSAATPTRLASLASQLAGDPTPFEGLVSVPLAKAPLWARLAASQPAGYYALMGEATGALVEALEKFVGAERALLQFPVRKVR